MTVRRALVWSLSSWLAATGSALAAAPTAPQPPLDPPPAPAPQDWQPRGNAEMRALNKVDAHATALTLHVGQTVHFGSLTITLQACVARPPTEVADSAAFVEVSDAHPGAPGFRGWLLADEPELNMLEHPVYGLRLRTCR